MTEDSKLPNATPAERAETRELARAVLEAVRARARSGRRVAHEVRRARRDVWTKDNAMTNRLRDDALATSGTEVPAMDVVLPDTDEKLRREGWRLHIYREHADGNVFLASERVLPEKVADPRAHRVFDSRRILLHPDEVTWLYVKLGELLEAK